MPARAAVKENPANSAVVAPQEVNSLVCFYFIAV